MGRILPLFRFSNPDTKQWFSTLLRLFAKGCAGHQCVECLDDGDVVCDKMDGRWLAVDAERYAAVP